MADEFNGRVPESVFLEMIDRKLATQDGRVKLLQHSAAYVRDRVRIGEGLTDTDKALLTRVARILEGCAEPLPQEEKCA